MRARTEGEVRIVHAFQVEAVWILKLACIAIGRPEHENNLLSAACFDATELEILRGYAARVLHRAFVTKQFLDGSPDEFGMITKLGGLLRVKKQRIETVPDKIAGGFVPTEEQHDALGIQLFFGKNVSIFFDLHKQANQIVAFLLVAYRNSFTKVIS